MTMREVVLMKRNDYYEQMVGVYTQLEATRALIAENEDAVIKIPQRGPQGTRQEQHVSAKKQEIQLLQRLDGAFKMIDHYDALLAKIEEADKQEGGLEAQLRKEVQEAREKVIAETPEQPAADAPKEEGEAKN